MPAPFGFSVGDVIAGIGVLVTAYNAIKDSGGAASRYQQHIIWLNQLIEVLEKLRLETDDTVPQLAEECKAILVAFKETIEAKYQTHLGAGGKKGKWPVDKIRKLQWAFLKAAEKDLVKLRNDVQPQLTAIGLHLDVQLKSAVNNVQTTTNDTLTAVETLSNATDRGFHDVRKALEALPGQIAAQASRIDSVQSSTATSATILTKTRTVGEETRDTFVQIKSTAPYLLKHDQYDDVAGLPPFVLACMKQVMKEVLKEHQEQLSGQEETSGTSWPTMHTDLPLRNEPLSEHIPSIPSSSQTTSNCTVVSNLSNTSRPVHCNGEPSIAIDNERAKPFFSARQLNLWFGILFTWTRTDVLDDDKSTYSSVTRVTKTTYYFWPAKWFSTTGAFMISETVCKAFRRTEVKYLWETYRVIPKDSPIIKACVDLDLPQIQHLFNKRVASPFDRDEGGSSLFDYCAAALRRSSKRSEIARVVTKLIPIAKYFISCGADLGQSTTPMRDCSARVYEYCGYIFGFCTTTFCHLLILSCNRPQSELTMLVRLIVDNTQTDPFKDSEVQYFLAAEKKYRTKHGIAERSPESRKLSFACPEVFEPVPCKPNSRSRVLDLNQHKPDFVDAQEIREMIETISNLGESRKALNITGSISKNVLWVIHVTQGQKVWTKEGMLLATQLAKDRGLFHVWNKILSNSRYAIDGQVCKRRNGVRVVKPLDGETIRKRRYHWPGGERHQNLQLLGDPLRYSFNPYLPSPVEYMLARWPGAAFAGSSVTPYKHFTEGYTSQFTNVYDLRWYGTGSTVGLYEPSETNQTFKTTWASSLSRWELNRTYIHCTI